MPTRAVHSRSQLTSIYMTEAVSAYYSTYDFAEHHNDAFGCISCPRLELPLGRSGDALRTLLKNFLYLPESVAPPLRLNQGNLGTMVLTGLFDPFYPCKLEKVTIQKQDWSSFLALLASKIASFSCVCAAHIRCL